MILSCSTDNHPQDVMLGSYQEQILPSEIMRSGVGYKGGKISLVGTASNLLSGETRCAKSWKLSAWLSIKKNQLSHISTG
jgi:hypothetical protein